MTQGKKAAHQGRLRWWKGCYLILDRLVYNKEYCWPLSRVPGRQSLKNCNSPSDRNVFVIHSGPLRPHMIVHANEMTHGGPLDHFTEGVGLSKETKHLFRGLDLPALLPTPNLQGRERDWRSSSIMANDLISHVYVMKSHIKTLLIQLNGTSWLVNLVIHWESGIPWLHGD